MNILAFAPHTDDVELGCGGSIARWAEEGHHIKYWFFSDCGWDGIIEECSKARRDLGIGENDWGFVLFERRKFTENRQNILGYMVQIRDEYSPDLVLIPSLNDKHQDHQVVAQEAVRAFNCSILGYELPWNLRSFDTQFFVGLEERHIARKVKALGRYKTQKFREYMDAEYWTSLARVRGGQARRKYAEAFEVVRWII